jgi:hypothetical protein
VASIMALPPDELRRLVRRDLIVAGAGAALALVAVAFLILGRIGVVSTVNGGRVAVVAALVAGVACFAWWASGPRIYLRDRVIVLTPVFLVAGPGLVGVHDLGGGVAVGILSGALGFTAAAALGLAWSSRR